MNRSESERTAYNYLERGLAHALKCDYGQAIIDFIKAIAIDPNCSDAYINRGIITKVT